MKFGLEALDPTGGSVEDHLDRIAALGGRMQVTIMIEDGPDSMSVSRRAPTARNNDPHERRQALETALDNCYRDAREWLRANKAPAPPPALPAG